ncbi:MAG: hypothetical protein COA42_06180 [Alteromonadaceae bacterium]|nr:MAG: hypothetical protein COA42_06180 [Alteromonadaceae bacterium]
MIRNKLHMLSALAVIFLLILIALNVVSSMRLKAHNYFFINEVDPRASALNEMFFVFGYGYSIHNFKNFVIRGDGTDRDARLLAKLDGNAQAFSESLGRYTRLINKTRISTQWFSKQVPQAFSKKERISLQTIRNTHQKYMKNVPLVTEAKRRGLSVVEVDRAVKISDAPAIAAFNNLYLDIRQLQETTLVETEKLANQIGTLMKISMAVLVILISSLIITAFQVLRPIVELTKKINEDDSIEAAVAAFKYAHKDEFSLLMDAIKAKPYPQSKGRP